MKAMESRHRSAIVRELKLRTAGPYDLREAWINDTGARVVAQEAGGRLDPDQATPLEMACRVLRISELIGIANDEPFVRPKSEIYRFRTTASDLLEFDRVFSGLNAVLLDPSSSVTLLATVDDYSVLAGPIEFLSVFQPSPEEALAEFREFARTQNVDLRPAALRAVDQFERYGFVSGDQPDCPVRTS